MEKYQSTDFEEYFSLVSDDEIMKYITGKGLNKDEAGKKFLSILRQSSVDAQLGYFKVFETSTNILLGDCKIVYNTHLERSLEIGYLLKKEFWQKGIGTLICAELIKGAREKFSDFKIIAIIDPENIPSRKLLEKFGFESYWKGIENDIPTEKLKMK
ncbi:GNAT family N-acetyltransferase [Myroides indicus]|uniref:GNAT family N-acetyltransferase n=1 Tax=Myroides indicus TaxID=1323422 RepID=UPI001FBABD12|nr:GNAT family N-acetyltransferase [Myroides indicus]